MRVSVRLFILLTLATVLCFTTMVVAVLLVGAGGPNPRLNPIEGFVLRVTLWSHTDALQQPLGTDATPVRFVIRQGDTASDIGFNLVKNNLIRDAELFRTYVRFYAIDARLQAGTYLLQQTQTVPQIAQALTDAGANTIKFLVREGWRAEEIADAINANGLFDFRGSDFLALVGKGAQPPADFAALFGLPSGASLEGFLFPATYELPLDATAADLRDRMLRKFTAELTPAMQSDVTRQKLTLYQAVTLASIVEREAVVADERPLIAGVYLNRLNKPMTLDADPTIQYALGNTRTPGTWWPNLTQADYRAVRSPYNTYLVQGLPPSPIANPGLSSIQAVIYPRESPYFYFRATCTGDGRHRFAVTFEEQVANGC